MSYSKSFKPIKSEDGQGTQQIINYENKERCNRCGDSGIIVMDKNHFKYAYKCKCNASKNYEALPAYMF